MQNLLVGVGVVSGIETQPRKFLLRALQPFSEKFHPQK